MKKLFFFLAAIAVAFTANAKVTTISPDAENDALRLAVHYAEDGDIIEMTEGTYVQCNNGYVEFDGKAVTVRAAEGANVVLQPQVRITIANGGKATFQNIKIDASQIHALADWYEHVFYVADATEGKELVLDGCEFYGFDVNNSAIYAGSDKKLDLCSLNNCYFYNNDKSCLFFEGESLGQLSVTNSTFANITAKVTDSYYAGVIDVRNPAAKVTVDHCTFYNCKLMHTDYAAVTMKGPQAANVVISNNIFMLPEAIDGQRAIRNDVEATNCMTFNYLKDNGGIHSSVTKTNCFLNVDPKFVDAANGNYALAEGSPALGAATDGSNLGDPRWNKPATKTVTIVVLPEGAATVTGAGEYEDGASVTVTASESDDYVFMGWMDYATEEIVAYDYEYTFQVLEDVVLIAYYIPFLEGESNDLVIGENTLTASAELSIGKLNMNLVLGEEEEGMYWLAETSTLSIDGNEAILLEGLAMVVPVAQAAVAEMLVMYNEALYYIGVVMYAPETGVDNITTTVAPTKIFKNGQILVVREGVAYDLVGRIVK